LPNVKDLCKSERLIEGSWIEAISPPLNIDVRAINVAASLEIWIIDGSMVAETSKKASTMDGSQVVMYLGFGGF
jgi:hypothetical protein